MHKGRARAILCTDSRITWQDRKGLGREPRLEANGPLEELRVQARAVDWRAYAPCSGDSQDNSHTAKASVSCFVIGLDEMNAATGVIWSGKRLSIRRDSGASAATGQRDEAY